VEGFGKLVEWYFKDQIEQELLTVDLHRILTQDLHRKLTHPKGC